MNKVNKYNDFILDSLLESVASDGTLPFLFSEEFLRILQLIKHPIADRIMNSENENKPVTFIDITEENDKISFTTSPKIIEYLANSLEKNKEDVKLLDFIKYNKSSNILWEKYRSIMKIGKLVKKIFENEYPDSGKPGEDIESFVNAYKAAFDKDNMTDLFELVSGDDIVKWYNINNYTIISKYNSVLRSSCMAEDCDDYIKFYAKNEKVKMLILYENDKKSKIIGRALVWSLDVPKDRKFMDRIYTTEDYQVNLFINYAKKNEWLYKYEQTYGDEPIVDTKDNSVKERELEIHDVKLNRWYPYLDTLQYLDQDEKVLSNVYEYSSIRLVETDGTARDSEWSEIYKEYINMYEISSKYVMCEIGFDRYTNDIDKIRKKEDAIFIKYYKEWVPKDRYDELIIKTTIGNEFEILKTDALYLKHYNGWTTDDYIQNNMIYSDYEHQFYFKDDIVKSKYIEDYILKDTAVKVYTDVTKIETDYIPDIEVPYRTYTDKNGDLIMKK
jgi:hypothetical protein